MGVYMKPEVASALYDFDRIIKYPYKSNPRKALKLYNDWDLNMYTDFPFVCVYCEDNMVDGQIEDNGTLDSSRVHILGGVYKVEDYIIENSYIIDMNNGSLDTFKCLSDAFLCDYSDFRNIIWNKSHFKDQYEWRDYIRENYCR